MAHWTTGDLVAAADLNSGFGLRDVVEFTANGTFTKADYSWLRHVRVRLVGGGGGGSGAGSAVSECQPGRGGSGGVYAESFIPVASLGSSETVTVGGGGAGGNNSTTPGSNGGTSSFGALVSGNGGTGGPITTSGTALEAWTGQSPPTTGTGDIVIPGGAGGGAVRLSSTEGLSGKGGDSQLGNGGGEKGQTGQNGGAGQGYGAGGSGAFDNTNTSRTGGAGAAGIVIVELYG